MKQDMCPTSLSEVLDYQRCGLFCFQTILIPQQAREKRFLWADQYIHWVEKDWEQILWSDESIFQVYTPDYTEVWVRKGENSQQQWKEVCRSSPKVCVYTSKFTIFQISVWGCMSPWHECLELTADRVDTQEYLRILKKCILPKVKELEEAEELFDYYFQQDNAPPHTAQVPIFSLRLSFRQLKTSLLIMKSQSLPGLHTHPISTLQRMCGVSSR